MYVSVNWVSIGSDNGLFPVPRQAIAWTNADLLSVGPLGTNFSEILIKISNFSFMKMHLIMSSGKWRPFCPGGDELITMVTGQPLRRQGGSLCVGWAKWNELISCAVGEYLLKIIWCYNYQIMQDNLYLKQCLLNYDWCPGNTFST